MGGPAETLGSEPPDDGCRERVLVRGRAAASAPVASTLPVNACIMVTLHLAAREDGLRIKGVDFIWTIAADIDRTAPFYRDVLGLPETGIQADDWREFQAGSATLAVTPAHVGLQPPRVLVALAVDDIDAALEDARALGVEVLHETRDTPACRNAMIADPEGNPIWLHQRHDGTFG